MTARADRAAYMRQWRAARKNSEVERGRTAAAAPSDAGREVSPPFASRPAPKRETHGTRAHYADGCRCDPCNEANNAYMRKLRKRQGSAYGSSDSYRELLRQSDDVVQVSDRTCEHCLTVFPSRTARKKHQCLPFTRIKPRLEALPELPVQIVIRHPRYYGGAA